MVDVGGKEVTRRSATARAIVQLTPEIMAQLHTDDGDMRTGKGSVFQTAVLAGIMAAKKTGELIPLCHPLPLDNCHVDIQVTDHCRIEITATASVTAKTGVEMEALTAASVAALTVYDMCKALSHDIVITEIRLISKTGGKSDYRAE